MGKPEPQLKRTNEILQIPVRVRASPRIINLKLNLMAKKTIREVIQSVKPGKIKSLSLNGIEVDGFRAEATRLSNRAREEGIVIPNDKPLYTISVNERVGCLFIINNRK